jgi:chromosome segregation ATPase
MNGRQNTYRLQHWQLAERQRYLSDLESLAAKLRADVEDLSREVDASASAPPASPDRRDARALVVGPLLERRDKLVRTIAEVDAQLAEARETVAAAQQEVKLYDGSVAYRGFTFEDRRVRRSRRPV